MPNTLTIKVKRNTVIAGTCVSKENNLTIKVKVNGILPNTVTYTYPKIKQKSVKCYYYTLTIKVKKKNTVIGLAYCRHLTIKRKQFDYQSQRESE